MRRLALLALFAAGCSRAECQPAEVRAIESEKQTLILERIALALESVAHRCAMAEVQP